MGFNNIKISMHVGLKYFILSGLLATNCLANPLRAPDLDDNKLYFICTHQLSNLFHVVNNNKTSIDDVLWQRVSALLMSAEIESQFKHYPSCVDKLARARYYLHQAQYEVPEVDATSQTWTGSKQVDKN